MLFHVQRFLSAGLFLTDQTKRGFQEDKLQEIRSFFQMKQIQLDGSERKEPAVLSGMRREVRRLDSETEKFRSQTENSEEDEGLEVGQEPLRQQRWRSEALCGRDQER